MVEHPDYAEIADRIRLLEEEKTAKESLETPQETLEAGNISTDGIYRKE